jgi:hypothetical protein
VSRVDELRRIHAEGLPAPVGAANPYSLITDRS